MEDWTAKVRTEAINRHDAWKALNLTIFKKLEYPLVALILIEEECDYIMTPVLNGGLPRAGIYRNIPRAILYRKTENQGLSLHKLHTTMGLQQI